MSCNKDLPKMRKLVFAAAIAGSALALAACSGGADDTAATAEADATVAGATDTATQAPAAATVLDANTATAEQLAAAGGVTPELATAIVAGRPYANVTALNAKLLETVEAPEAATVLTNVFVPVNLNTGSEDDIKLIPGMTPKMVHEFLEYRPYADMGVFDREIGKYVDAAEVARFRNYVTL
jgi:DNA uptake protein ComE-like DNA-binding protein